MQDRMQYMYVTSVDARCLAILTSTLHCKLQEKLLCKTGPLDLFACEWKLVSIWKALHQASHWKGDLRHFRNNLLIDLNLLFSIEQELKQPSDQRIHVLAAAFKEGYSIDQLYELTKIDKWFLSRMKCIMDYALKLKGYRDKTEVKCSLKNFFSSKPLPVCILYYRGIKIHSKLTHSLTFSFTYLFVCLCFWFFFLSFVISPLYSFFFSFFIQLLDS